MGVSQLADNKVPETILSDDEPENVKKGICTGGDCGVREDQFPSLGKCCRKVSSITGIVYQQTCPYLSIWTSLPDGTSLAITYIFGCTHYGFARRVRE